MKLKLDLSSHCIQTELKRQHNRAVSDYFRADRAQHARIEQVVEITREALCALDFGALRSHHPRLAGNADADAELEKRGATVRVLLDGVAVASFRAADG